MTLLQNALQKPKELRNSEKRSGCINKYTHCLSALAKTLAQHYLESVRLPKNF